MTTKERFFWQNRIVFWENIIFAIKFQCHEKKEIRDIVSVGVAAVVWFLCLLGVERDAQGRASDGADGEALCKAIWQGQVGPLQASVEENQAYDEAG